MSLGSRPCQFCEKIIFFKARRDIERQKYCSHSCRQKFRASIGDWPKEKMWAKAYSPEANAKKSQLGDKNPRYLKDRSLVKTHYLPAERNHWRREVYKKCGRSCVLCGSTKALRADHIKPICAYSELRYDINNGRTICERCDVKSLTYGEGAKKMREERRRGFQV